MGFKLGSSKGLDASGGEIKTKLSFRANAVHTPGTPIIRTDLAGGIGGEANMDGSIYISNAIEAGSFEERQIINHEMRHATDIKIGKLEYGDDFIKYNGVTHPRRTINGEDRILHDGEWKEAGSDEFPWELDANNGNTY
jgi:hypothetical protein